MKKLLTCFTFLILFTAITCENEPLDDGVIENEQNNSCEQAILNTADAALAFLSVTEDNYEELCINYRTALELQIQRCGDDNGQLQGIIDELGDCTNDGVQTDDCEDATTAAQNAEEAFENATDDDYEDLCNAYKSSLEQQIDVCGDDGTIQTIINDLGECIPSAAQGGITFNAGSSPQNFDIVDVVQEGNILKVTAKTSANGASNYELYFEVTEGETGVDIINDTFYLTLTSTLYPDTSGFNDFTSEITENGTSILKGTFGGIVRNDDNGVLELTQGIIDISY